MRVHVRKDIVVGVPLGNMVLQARQAGHACYCPSSTSGAKTGSSVSENPNIGCKGRLHKGLKVELDSFWIAGMVSWNLSPKPCGASQEIGVLTAKGFKADPKGFAGCCSEHGKSVCPLPIQRGSPTYIPLLPPKVLHPHLPNLS